MSLAIELGARLDQQVTRLGTQCVGSMSPGDCWSEIEGKGACYLASGADGPSRVLTDCDILDGEDVVLPIQPLLTGTPPPRTPW